MAPDSAAETAVLARGLARAVEIPLAALALAASLPLLAVAALAIRLTSGAPVLFRHKRVGLGGRAFDLLKLRTMTPRPDGPEVTAEDDPRITRVGSWLRRLKLDELPQLWNVLRGDMALVGPRPEAARYIDRRDLRWDSILAVRPGLTDPASLLYRDEERQLAAVPGDRDRHYREVVLPAKLEVSAAYVLTRTWRSDVAVLARTMACLVLPAACQRKGQVAVPRDS